MYTPGLRYGHPRHKLNGWQAELTLLRTLRIEVIVSVGSRKAQKGQHLIQGRCGAKDLSHMLGEFKDPGIVLHSKEVEVLVFYDGCKEDG
jgi:hypothetical protein